jgi:hypothetical protein
MLNCFNDEIFVLKKKNGKKKGDELRTCSGYTPKGTRNKGSVCARADVFMPNLLVGARHR